MIKLLIKIFQKLKIKNLTQKISTSLSDNQQYPQVCLDASNSYKSFNNFRRNTIYNQILEHVSEQPVQE